MTCWAVIPLKGPELGKQRLAEALNEDERRRLVEAMLGRVAEAIGRAVTIDRAFILGPSTRGLAVPTLADPGGGLNAALAAASEAAEQGGAQRVVFVAADLPFVTSRDVELLSLAPEGAVAIAPDRHRTGTNAISLPLPAARGFGFAFGPDSFARHGEEIRRIGLALEIIESPGLMRDIDVPADLVDVMGLLGD